MNIQRVESTRTSVHNNTTQPWALKRDQIIPRRTNIPPAKDWASTSAVKAVFGLQPLPLCRSSARCSPSTFLHLPYKKLCRMSEVITSESERGGHLNPDFRARVSAGSTEPILRDANNKLEEQTQRREVTEEVELREEVDTKSCFSVRAPAPRCLRVKHPCLTKRVLYISGWREPCLITY